MFSFFVLMENRGSYLFLLCLVCNVEKASRSTALSPKASSSRSQRKELADGAKAENLQKCPNMFVCRFVCLLVDGVCHKSNRTRLHSNSLF